MKLKYLALLPFAWLLWGGLGCGPGGTIKQCENDEICGSGQICQSSICVAGCRSSDQCKTGELCLDSRCQEPSCKPGTQEACYEGPPDTKGTGPCKEGVRFCLADAGKWSPCVLQQLPIPETCDQEDNDCDGKVDEGLTCECQPGRRRTCYTGPPGTLQVGDCRAGIQYCEPDARWGKCYGQIRPLPEQCDQKDNNCNGMIDEWINCECKAGATRACYTGPKDSQGKGICKDGKQSCQADNRWGPCVGEVLPALEEDFGCDGKDNNCDGKVDKRAGNSAVELKEFCYTGNRTELRAGSLCREGVKTCAAGTWSDCVGERKPKLEVCNGEDDDCNGTIDDNCPTGGCRDGSVQRCYPKDTKGCTKEANNSYSCQGSCRAGLSICTGGKWEECQLQEIPGVESCNGKDDDCDGKPDNGATCPSGQSCQAGRCVADSRPEPRPEPSPEPRAEPRPEPSPDAGEPAPDAREPVPEKPPEPNLRCQAGEKRGCDTQRPGVCRLGQQTCTSGAWGPCLSRVSPGIEKCDGLDDDCDGLVDEDCQCSSGQSRSCYGGPAGTLGIGPCKAGTQACQSDGRWGPCLGATRPKTEECNGKDDDCDGYTDETYPQFGTTCLEQSTIIRGECRRGTLQCKSGALVCVAARKGSAETCNGLDDNCDGQIDERLSRPCYTGAQGTKDVGLCKGGTQTCAQGTYQACVGEITPTTELCNTKDDDCDGIVDEDFPDKGKACIPAGQTAACGGWRCLSGVKTCVATGTAIPELCDGKDNDCDGTIDEDLPVVSCGLGECINTAPSCINGKASTACTPTAKKSATCDGKDNDCDGQIDCSKTLTLTALLNTEKPRGIVYDPQVKKLYLTTQLTQTSPAASTSQLHILDPASKQRTLLHSFSNCDHEGLHLDVDPFNTLLYVPLLKNAFSGCVTAAIVRYTSAGALLRLTKSNVGYSNGATSATSFNGASGVAFHSSNFLYSTDTYNHRIRVFDLNKGFGDTRFSNNLAGSGTAGHFDGTSSQASFNEPTDVAIGPAGFLYVADSKNHRIRRVDRSTGQVITIAGSGGTGLVNGLGDQAQFNTPFAITVDAQGAIYVADLGNHAIRKLHLVTINGKVTAKVSTLAGTGSPGNKDTATGQKAQFNEPYDLTFSNADGKLYVTDKENRTIRVITQK